MLLMRGTCIASSMKCKIVRKLHYILLLGISSMILTSLLLMYQQNGSNNSFLKERNVSKNNFARLKQTTKEHLRSTTTYERVRSAFQLLGYSNMTLMAELKEDRPSFEYVLEPWKTKCSDDAVNGKGVAWSMIVAVKSNSINGDRRQTIRETWGSYKYSNDTRLEILFIVGLPKNTKDQDVISFESSKNGDILQINKVEEYEEVGLKTIVGMQWVTNHCQSNWIYASSDDDMVPNVDKFYRSFESQGVREMAKSRTPPNGFPIICNFSLREKRVPIRNKRRKNNVSPEIYSAETYPTFCAGGFYSMSVEICKILFRTSRSHKYFYNDDVWITGLLRLAAIDAGHIPCHDVTDEHCKVSKGGSYNVKHFYGNIKKMMKFWKDIESKSTLS